MFRYDTYSPFLLKIRMFLMWRWYSIYWYEQISLDLYGLSLDINEGAIKVFNVYWPIYFYNEKLLIPCTFDNLFFWDEFNIEIKIENMISYWKTIFLRIHVHCKSIRPHDRFANFANSAIFIYVFSYIIAVR